ncbi:siah interacting protein, amine-terminal protein (macronuclear) [Tetrahymena thermophila SB210]|uniref:Calcyclin-binding protein n=1 Tax=Tetrahymena thermophila (strain SB210) TaxID=312017 RepID=W7XCZ8_TETTS|nr:siah interacting protein, amine-terminal protein [Tetrahymena thermophila SB210]EWS74478.1 siah interacting protein, amine-terminal protein [Tetrahymena thermophila SB210]|eukprot:XP_012652963.1 siah interacting protein, amine-terminal protein [Tetrahymena thermophila SB210]
MDLKESQLDLEELKSLLTQSRRVNVQELLKKQIRHIEVEIEQIQKAQASQEQQKSQVMEEEKPSAKPADQQQNLKFITLTKYAWDQNGQNVNVSLYIDDISKVNPSNVQVTFTDQSFEVKVLDLNGRNYKFAIPKLYDKIKPSECKYVIKSSSISIKMKATKSYWSQLTYKEDAFKAKGSDEDSKDPSKSLMDMMKNLYETGDDKMKETIAKSFQQAQRQQMNPNSKDKFGDNDFEDF